MKQEAPWKTQKRGTDTGRVVKKEDRKRRSAERIQKEGAVKKEKEKEYSC